MDVLGCPGDCGSVGKGGKEVLSDEALAELLGGGCGGECGNFFARIVKAVRSKKNKQTQQKGEVDDFDDGNESDQNRFLSQTELDYEDFETFVAEKSIKLEQKSDVSEKS